MTKLGGLNSPVLLLASFFLVGCSSSNIRSDHDSAADFSQYKTYNFYDDAGPDGSDYRGFFSRYMVAAISRELEQRGYVKSDDPDLLVNFNAIMQEKTEVRTVPTTPSIGGYYSYRRGFYKPWPTYTFASETKVSQYTEGTFNIDLVDAYTGRLVWEAIGQGRISRKKLENLQENVDAGVTKYFALYPFVAGGGND